MLRPLDFSLKIAVVTRVYRLILKLIDKVYIIP